MNCQIIIKSHLDERRSKDFEGLSLELLSDGRTLLKGVLADQAALYSVLTKIRDMGLTLVTVYTSKEDM